MDWQNYTPLHRNGDEHDRVKANSNVQRFARESFHRWYTFILGYSNLEIFSSIGSIHLSGI